MKNVKRLFLAAVALVSASSMAALVQPIVPVSEATPVGISIGATGKLIAADKFGINKAGIGLGFIHNVYDFEYGLSGVIGYGALGTSRILTSNEAEKKASGITSELELILRFMPEIANRLHVGANFGLGWGMQFGETAKKVKTDSKIKFGDMNFKVGPAFSYGFTESFSMYFAPSMAMTSIRFSEADANKDEFKKTANLWGAEFPIGLVFGVGDQVDLFVDINNKLLQFNNLKTNWRLDATLGVRFAI